jgi:hypothetical protein
VATDFCSRTFGRRPVDVVLPNIDVSANAPHYSGVEFNLWAVRLLRVITYMWFIAA